MKGHPIDQLVYECMFPKPKSVDPQTFQAFLQRSLVPEVRLETQAFYGHLTSQEAKYPGLDYSYPPHRVRLSRFPWHRRLFRAFDNLKLTNHEIATLTKWEGTRWAKERFEREQGIVIRDTTGDGIEDWVPPELRSASVPHAVAAHEEVAVAIEGQLDEHDLEDDDGGESDNEMTSVGAALNERLRAAVAQRAAGNLSAPMDPEWEQWLKDAVEGGSIDLSNTELSPDANIVGTRPIPSFSRAIVPFASQFARIYRPSDSTIPLDTTGTRRVQRPAIYHGAIHRGLSESNNVRDHAQHSIAADNHRRTFAAQNAEPRNSM